MYLWEYQQALRSGSTAEMRECLCCCYSPLVQRCMVELAIVLWPWCSHPYWRASLHLKLLQGSFRFLNSDFDSLCVNVIVKFPFWMVSLDGLDQQATVDASDRIPFHGTDQGNKSSHRKPQWKLSPELSLRLVSGDGVGEGRKSKWEEVDWVFSFSAMLDSSRNHVRGMPQDGCLYRACCRASIIQRISLHISSICCPRQIHNLYFLTTEKLSLWLFFFTPRPQCMASGFWYYQSSGLGLICWTHPILILASS